MVDQLIKQSKLPCAECGYPIVDTDLCWHQDCMFQDLGRIGNRSYIKKHIWSRRAAKRIVRVARKKSIQVV